MHCRTHLLMDRSGARLYSNNTSSGGDSLWHAAPDRRGSFRRKSRGSFSGTRSNRPIARQSSSGQLAKANLDNNVAIGSSALEKQPLLLGLAGDTATTAFAPFDLGLMTPLDRNSHPSRTGQMRHSTSQHHGFGAAAASTAVVDQASPTSSNDVSQDCFIVPAHRLAQFMPIPLADVSSRAFNMMQLDDPSVCIVLDFLEALKPLAPSIPTLVSGPHPLTVQLDALKDTMQKVGQLGSALEGMVLMNMERNSVYPCISYMVVNTSATDPAKFMTQYHSIMVEYFSPAKIQHIGDHHISVYEEVATIARPPIDLLPKKPSNAKTGYIITVFKVFPGDDREKLERSWLMWTGARMMYKYLPKFLGLKRITFHKKLWPNGGITYVLLCECSNLMDYVTEGCGFVGQLRARCCGYTGVYKIVDNF